MWFVCIIQIFSFIDFAVIHRMDESQIPPAMMYAQSFPLWSTLMQIMLPLRLLVAGIWQVYKLSSYYIKWMGWHEKHVIHSSPITKLLLQWFWINYFPHQQNWHNLYGLALDPKEQSSSVTCSCAMKHSIWNTTECWHTYIHNMDGINSNVQGSWISSHNVGWRIF